jgi:hypothetical protein
VPLKMRTPIIAAFTVASLGACTKGSTPVEKSYLDPISGSKTVVNVVDLGDLELVAARDRPDGFGTLNVHSKPILSYSCSPDGSCVISIFVGKVPSVTISTQSQGRALKGIWVTGSEWNTFDNTGTGLSDTRVANGSKVAEIWLNGQWTPRSTTFSGGKRRYFVGDREVVLSEHGWVYRGT